MRYYADNVVHNDNEKILDLRMGYTYDEVINYISGLTNDSKNYYIQKFHFVDTFYPIIYCAFYILILSFLLKNIFSKNKMVNIILAIPFVGTVCDYAENALINSFIENSPNISKDIVRISSNLTKVKFITIYFSLFLAVSLIIYLFIMRRINK
jgi:hypothetical protein